MQRIFPGLHGASRRTSSSARSVGPSVQGSQGTPVISRTTPCSSKPYAGRTGSGAVLGTKRQNFIRSFSRLVTWMRAVCGAHSPDNRTNPAQRGKQKINDRSQNKHPERAVILVQHREFQTQRAVRQREHSPAQQTRQQQLRRRPEKAKQRDRK